jgi:hypothetical protein
MSYKEILKVIPTLQAANLVQEISKKKKKNKMLSDIPKIFVGVPLIKIESDLISTL